MIHSSLKIIQRICICILIFIIYLRIINTTSYNNNNCNFEKYEGAPLEDDCDTDKRIIELG